MTDFEARRAARQEALTQVLADRKKKRLQKGLEKPKRRKICVTLPLDLYDWLCTKVSDGTYYNISHGLESCVKETRRHQVKKDR
jgi:hypothetical protein